MIVSKYVEVWYVHVLKLLLLFIFSGCAAQRGLWPPVALQPSAGYGLLWLCSPARAVASCGSAAQLGLWPPVALQPSTGYGLLWLCSPARAMASCGSAAQLGLWPPRSRGFVITHNDAPQSVGLLWTSDRLVAKTSTWQHTYAYALDRAATGTDTYIKIIAIILTTMLLFYPKL
jgi:hypothetical protein